MKWKDEIVEEVRTAREAYAAQLGCWGSMERETGLRQRELCRFREDRHQPTIRRWQYVRQVSDIPTYPANLCLLCGRLEFADLRKDLGERINETIQCATRGPVRQGAPVHLEDVLRRQHGIANSDESGARR